MLKVVYELLKQVFFRFTGSLARNHAENLNSPEGSVPLWNFEFGGSLGYIGNTEEKTCS